jgi:hypothetical protein
MGISLRGVYLGVAEALDRVNVINCQVQSGLFHRFWLGNVAVVNFFLKRGYWLSAWLSS